MPALRRSTVEYFVYPLSAESGYSFDGAAISPENLWASALNGTTDEWGLSNGYRLVEPGDWIWAYFGAAVRQICAVGTVHSPVGWREDWGRYSVQITWNKKLTARLKANPIAYDLYRQQVQGAVVRANNRTRRVLEGWVAGEARGVRQAARSVKFAQRSAIQRLGQPQFRVGVLRAYSGECAITGCAEPSALQAAHIVAVAAGGTHDVENSILLRADVHNLFDLGTITVTNNMTVEVSPEVRDPVYRGLAGRSVSMPQGARKAELKKAFSRHRKLHKP